MIRTIASIFITFALIFGVSFYEVRFIRKSFAEFEEILRTFQEKTEAETAVYEDGTALRAYWSKQKDTLHIWIPHTSLQEIDYQLNEAIGYIYIKDYQSALPKLEILLGLCESIPKGYSIGWGNIF